MCWKVYVMIDFWSIAFGRKPDLRLFDERHPTTAREAREHLVAEVGRLELIRESLVAVVNEMRANIIHSSYSSIIYEGHDFSCAIIAADGRLVAQSIADHPTHIFSVPYSAAEILKKFKSDINEGDIFLHNDPYTGGTHLNDVLMLFPVFHDKRLTLFAATRCHWGDVGGMTAGSLSGRVREIYQEGIRIVPTRICDRGRLNEAYLTLLFDNMRIPDERRGDFNAMLGTSRKANEHLQRLFKRYGGTQLLDGIEELIARSEAVMRRRIREIPEGQYFTEGYLDNDGHGSEPLLARLKLTVRADTIVADFSGSSPQTMGPMNVGPAMALNSVATVVKSFLDPRAAINHGSFSPIEVVNPVGSFLNAKNPACCGGMAECRALLVSLTVSALGQALPKKRVGDLRGTANHVYVAGQRRGGENYLLYEYPAGGTGATEGRDGDNGVRSYIDGDFNAVWSVEVMEAQCAVQVESYGIREGSGGVGQFRGGCGIRRDIRITGDRADLSVLSDHCVIPPYGVATGHSGAANRFSVFRNGEEISASPIPGKISGFELTSGDLVRIETAGGGGYGDPLARELSRVREDVALGLIDRDQARSHYGAVIEGGDVDADASGAERRSLMDRRVVLAVEPTLTDQFDGTKRVLGISPGLFAKLGIQNGSVVELAANSCGSSLRCWADLGPASSTLSLGPMAMKILGVKPGESVELRGVTPSPPRQALRSIEK
jgi:N-methylhydantoinase B